MGMSDRLNVNGGISFSTVTTPGALGEAGINFVSPGGEARRVALAMENQRLVDHYRKWFDIIPAATPDLVRESQRLRYQVYCLETGFENKKDFPDGLECDLDDSRSVCSLLIHRPTGMVAGTVRLILPDRTVSGRRLPAFTVSDSLSALDEATLPRRKTAEISRFAISKEFRKRREDSHIPALYEITGDPGDQRVIPHITLGLMQAILSMSLANDISHLATVVEPTLDRLIRRLGIFFKPIGPLVDHHGRRRAHYRDIASLLDDVYRTKPAIWEVLTQAGALWPMPRMS